jgi:hypothetical protein
MYNAPEFIATAGQVSCQHACFRFYFTTIPG